MMEIVRYRFYALIPIRRQTGHHHGGSLVQLQGQKAWKCYVFERELV